jgi:hypothetical protein
MKKEQASDLIPKKEQQGMTKWQAHLALSSLAVALVRGSINDEVIKSFNQATEVLDISHDDDKNQKPPKPPRHPGTPLRVVLGNT